MTRSPDWPEKLARFIEERRNRPFDWAGDNCGFTACDWLALAVGADPAADFRGYDSRLSITRAVRRAGGLDAIAEAAAQRWGWRVEVPSLLHRGDIASKRTDRGQTALGICLGLKSAFMSSKGMAFVPTATCERGWRIL
jgi:hypothetical protein